jgi:Delta7-sterol 5-desaturase
MGHPRQCGACSRRALPDSTDFICGVVTWLWEPIDSEGGPIRDKHNPDKRLRARPILGISLLEDFQRIVNEESMEGRIYNPENGRTYRASLKLRSPDLLEVKGCLFIACDTQVWRRVEAVCAMHPKQIDVPDRSR